jgi:transmembrane sensor
MDKHSQIVSLRTSDTIDHEAADWLAKLDGGNLSTEERHALKVWLSQDPEHAQALKSLSSIWSDMDILLNDCPGSSKVKTTSLFSLMFGTKWLSPTLAAICLGFIAVFVWMTVPVNQPAKIETSFYATKVGVQKLEKFSDGSSAHLNTDSIMETEFSGSSRIVRLLRGEAMFDVAHDPARPFIVYVGNSKVKAIGTKFIIRLTSESIVVTVTEGKVQLSKRSEEASSTLSDQDEASQEQEVIVVSKGEEVEVNDKIVDDTNTVPRPKEVNSDELDQRISWMSGQLVFKNERLEQVIAEISRYVPARIIIDDPELKDVRISGRFEIGDTDALLEAIEVSFNVQADHVDEQIIHLSR